ACAALEQREIRGDDIAYVEEVADHVRGTDLDPIALAARELRDLLRERADHELGALPWTDVVERSRRDDVEAVAADVDIAELLLRDARDGVRAERAQRRRLAQRQVCFGDEAVFLGRTDREHARCGRAAAHAL